MAVIYIVVLIGVLVFVHELGHFLAAKLFNVKVLNFSIGFGPRLLGKRIGDTEWEIRALPLGGFVQMYGNEFEEVVDKDADDFDRAFNNKPIWQKAIINLAGPLFNLLLPIPILFAVYFATATEDLPSHVGQVLDNSPAQGLLLPGDQVLSIQGESIKHWTELHRRISESPNKALKLEVLRAGKIIQLDVTPEAFDLRDSQDVMTTRVGRIGITPDKAAPIVGLSDLISPAAQAGFQSFDEIVAINGNAVSALTEVEDMLAQHQGQNLSFDVLRGRKLNVNYGRIEALELKRIDMNVGAKSLEDLGLVSANMFITDIDPGSPADKAGLQVGDQIIAMDGQKYNVFRSFVDRLAQTWEREHVLTVRRHGFEFDTKIQLERLTITGEFQEEQVLIYAGFYNKLRIVQSDLLARDAADRFFFAIENAVNNTIRASTMLVVYVLRMVQGRVSTKSLGGPIMIGHMASKAGADGLDAFLRMLAIISINLGILNLLPIPLLDGGKLVVLAIEAVKRGPLSMRTRQVIAYVGFAMVGLLMMLAFKNDLERLWNMFFS